MATLEAILKISDENVNGRIDVATTNIMSNNISQVANTYDILDFIENMSADNQGFGGARVTMIGSTSTISALRIGTELADGRREETYKGMLFGYSDSNKDGTLTITLEGQDIIGISITFDKFTNQFPTIYSYTDVAGISSGDITNTSNTITISGMQAGYGTVTITFKKWNLANTPIGITFISFPTETITLTKAQIVSFTSQAQIVTTTNGLNYSVIPTTGKIEINDKSNILYEKAKLGYLNAYLFTLELLLNGKAVQKHISTNSPLYTSDRMINLDLTDELSLWDSIKVRSEDFSVGKTLYDVVIYLATYYPSIDVATMCDKSIVIGNSTNGRSYDSISNYLSSISFTNITTLQEGTLREQFEKVCNCAQLSIYVTRDNEIKFTSARPIDSQNVGVIVIPFKKQYSRPDYDLLVSNRYEDVEFK